MNWSCSLPAITSSQALSIALPIFSGSTPARVFARAHAFLIDAMLTIISPGRRLPVIEKFSAARKEWMP